jgi:hypothetical protein
VLVEAVPFPRGTVANHPSVLLQVWPEPRLQWGGVATTAVSKAIDTGGTRLVREFTSGEAPARRHGDGVVLVRTADGKAIFVRDTGGAFEPADAFRANPRQDILRFRATKSTPSAARELAITLFGTVRSGNEPVCQVRGLESNQPRKITGPNGTELAVMYSQDGGGRRSARVEISYDPRAVVLAGVNDDLPGARGGGSGAGNQTLQGIRVTDAAGKPYGLGLSSGLSRRDPTDNRSKLVLQLSLYAGKGEIGPPDSVTLWGTYLKSVQVPVVLNDVPLFLK